MKSSFVLIDQAAGQKQIAILSVFEHMFSEQSIIAGSINKRDKGLGDNVKWERAIKYNRKNALTRLFTWLVFTVQAFIIIKRKYKESELFIITNPPTSIFLTLLLKNKFRILVFDLYPDAFYEYGYLKKTSFLYRLWSKTNKKILNRADRIYTLSHGMSDKLSAYVNKDKIEIVELWTNSNFLMDVVISENHFADKFGLSNKFVVLYSGNMGITHPVEKILEIARRTKDQKEILFVLIGGGHKYNLIKNQINIECLENVLIMPWLEAKELPYSFNASCVGFVTLDNAASKLSVPSKVFDLFAVGLPVIGIGSGSSELSLLLDKYGAGRCFEQDNIDGMLAFLLDLKNSKELYSNFRASSFLAAKNHTPKNALNFI